MSRVTAVDVHTCAYANCSCRLFQVTVLLSEPTASRTRWDDNFEHPFVTVCPSVPYYNMTAIMIMFCGSAEKKRGFYGNDSLLALFRREGLSLDELLFYRTSHGENISQDSESFLATEGTWTRKYDYARGGLCGSFKSNGEFSLLNLSRSDYYGEEEIGEDYGYYPSCRYDGRYCVSGDCGSVDNYQNHTYETKYHGPHYAKGNIIYNIYRYNRPHTSMTFFRNTAYRIHIHCHNDFWGAEDRHLAETLSDAEMVSLELMNTFQYQELVIHVDREILPNLRRQPCEEDPSYSLRSCWLRCFLRQFNCSMGGEDGKPICSASDMSILHAQMYAAFVEDAQSSPIPPCLCQRPCMRERYSLFVRPAVTHSPSKIFTVPVRFRPVRRTIETFVTYKFVDLLADMGGYLGLLLGYSLLTIFDDLKTVCRSLFRSIKTIVVGLDDSLSGMEYGAERTPGSVKEARSRRNHRRSLRARGWDRRFRGGSRDSTWSFNLASSPQRRERGSKSHRSSRLPSAWEESDAM